MLAAKIRTLAWYGSRPKFWRHAVELGVRKLRNDARFENAAPLAREWAKERSLSVDGALRQMGLLPNADAMPSGLHNGLLAEAEAACALSGAQMGGAGDLALLHAAVLLTKSRKVVETGVAYGWSSLAILDALTVTGGQLASVDMPYAKRGTEAAVGIAVPERLRTSWMLIREPDRNGLKKALRHLGGSIDLCHYDSDKSYAGRLFAYPLLWDALKNGGVFISDDIQDNFAFKEFAEGKGRPYAVAMATNKFVGMIVK